MKKLLYAIIAIPILCSSAFAALSSQGWSYYEKPGEKIITTPFAIFSSSRIIFTSPLSGIQWHNGTLSTCPVTSGGASAHGDLTQLDYASSGHTGFATDIDTGTLKADIASHYAELKSTGAALSALTTTVSNIQISTPSAASRTNWDYAFGSIDSSETWNTAYTDRLKWDGGATDLVAATGRTSLALVPDTNIPSMASYYATGASTGAIKATVDGHTTSITNLGTSTGTIKTTVDSHTTSITNLGESTGTINTLLLAVQASTPTIGVDVQAYDADLDDAADGSFTGSKIGDGVPAANIAAGSLDTDVIVSSLAVNAVYPAAVRTGAYNIESATVDEVILGACFQVYGATTTAGVKAVQISPVYDHAVTITTMTICVIGGTSVAGMIEQRAKNAEGSAGTDIWSGDVTATTVHTGGTIADFTMPANYSLWFVPTTWTGAVDSVIFSGEGTRD